MAKRLIHWSLEGSVLSISKALEDPKATAIIEASFEITKLFPTYDSLTDCQKYLIVYGIKQRLADTGADQIADAGGKIANAKAIWADLLIGKVKGERANATGAADNKKFKAAITEEAKVVSLEGLVLKKAMAKIPGQPAFTEEDEAKLQEFFGIMADHAAKSKGKAKN
jgi:hypothetical protein